MTRLASSRVLKNPQNVIDDKRMALLAEERMLYDKMQSVLRGKKADLGEKAAKLDALNPLAVLARGYAAVFEENGKVITRTEDVRIGETVMLAMADGKLKATVDGIEKHTENAEKE